MYCGIGRSHCRSSTVRGPCEPCGRIESGGVLAGSLMLSTALVGVLALALSAFTYLVLERLGRRSLIPLICRAVAWTALGLLVVNLSCAVQGGYRRPLVLLDASLSLGAAGGRWAEARD